MSRGLLDVVHGAFVHRLPSVPLAGYTNARVGLGGVNRVKRILADYPPDGVHLASFVENVLAGERLTAVDSARRDGDRLVEVHVQRHRHLRLLGPFGKDRHVDAHAAE